MQHFSILNPSTRKEESFSFLKKIASGRTKVFIIEKSHPQKKFCLKAFPYENNQISELFQTEIRFDRFSHSNLIKVHNYDPRQQAVSEGRKKFFSFLILEYAPFGDFIDIQDELALGKDEKLARTYFHQLVSALEYLHSHEVAHMDIKLDNILLGEDYKLKLADFDLAVFEEKLPKRQKGFGSKFYRAPEIRAGQCENPKAADIYSLGIVMFLFKSGCRWPYIEDQKYQEFDLWSLMKDDKKKFWEFHEGMKPKVEFEEEFKDLFMKMTDFDFTKRPSIKDIKENQWFNGPIYSEDELIQVMKSKKIKEIY